MEFISEGKKKDAMKILNKLKKNLKKEYSYYNKDSVKIFIEPNNVYRTYH
ncbi:hypothetical protein H477_4038 [[Clostridium] sordellii ATCC 9714]|nr:hypothetical protein H477_4038 [[Clostridium] sordellii ATCC 9714] [Paeniclostridium sordellii ATCC 9714]